MCVTVALPDGRVLTTPRDLTDHGWPVMPADWDDDDPDEGPDDDDCLCWIDVEAILNRHLVVFRDEGGWIQVLQ